MQALDDLSETLVEWPAVLGAFKIAMIGGHWNRWAHYDSNSLKLVNLLNRLEIENGAIDALFCEQTPILFGSR